jgi:hypothetical protein
MSVRFPQPRFVPCSSCGAAVERSQKDDHVCDRTRRLDYQMFQLREDVAALDAELRAYFDSPRGRFELWFAERERREGTDA